MKITYRELLKKLQLMSDARLDDDVTVSMDLSEEVVPVKYIHPIKDDDLVCGGVLDAGHFVLAVDF